VNSGQPASPDLITFVSPCDGAAVCLLKVFFAPVDQKGSFSTGSPGLTEVWDAQL
jgi:hypothetical protein